MKKKLVLPNFKNESEEQEFWGSIDISDFYEKSDALDVAFPNLKPTTRSISIRLPDILLYRIKESANEKDIPYQTLIKSTLSEIFLSGK